MRRQAIRVLVLLIVLVAGASTVAALPATGTRAPLPRYRAGPAIGYTYGPLDEIRLDVSYVLDENGAYEGVPGKGFTERGRYYEPVSWSEPAEDGSVVVTYAERPASEAPKEKHDRNSVIATACATGALLPLAAAVAVACPGEHETNEKYPNKKGKSS